MSKSQIPIVRNMNALPDRTRHEAVGAELIPQSQNVVPLDDGYQIDFPIGTLKLVAEFVDGERRCCPFLHFKIDIEPSADVVRMQLTGADGTKQLLERELLPNLS